MLTIRPEQMAVFDRRAEELFKGRLFLQLARDYPKHFEAMGDQAFRDLIQHAIEGGLTHGIEGQGEVAALAELMLRFGKAFELSPERDWAQKVLAKSAMPGSARLSMIWNRMEQSTGGRLIVPAKMRKV
jgi:hypothetical protein